MLREDLILDTLLDWNLWGNMNEKLKNRLIIPKIPKSNIILTITGVRRSGKSKLTYLLAKKLNKIKTLFLNFEDPRLKNISSEEILKVVEIYQQKISKGDLPELLILDEVQNVEGWERAARYFQEAKKVKVIVTGSSSKLLSSEYSSVLTGRHIDFELFPLSFKEFLDWKGIKVKGIELYKQKIRIKSELENYMLFGGFPEIALIENKQEKMAILRQYLNDIIVKDIVVRYRIKEIRKIEELGSLYISHIASLQSYNRLKDVVGLSLDSVERFSRYFEEAKLLFFIRKFSYSLKQQILSQRKVYSIDHGLFNSSGFKFSQNKGKIMENIVAVELLRRKSYLYPKREIYYWKDYKQREVDFIIKEGDKIIRLIQVTYISNKDEIEKREIKSLLKASDVLKCNDLLIITYDYKDKEEIDGKTIVYKPLWEWLIEN